MQNMDENQGSKEEDLKGKIWEENKKTWVVAGPAIFTRFSTFGITVISQAFIGHIGPTELAAFALVATLLARFANGLLERRVDWKLYVGKPTEQNNTTCSGYISNDHGIVLIVVTTTVLVPIYIFAAPILKALGQDEVIAKVAGNIALCVFVIIPRFPVLASNSEVQIRSERHFDINNLAYWVPNVGQLIFVISGGCRETWKGFTTLAFKDLWPVVKLSLSSGAMICLELWYNAILILLTGNLKNAEVELDALSICLNINGWEMMISFGFMAAASVRVSNELGKGDSKAAKFSIVNIVLTSFSIGFVLFVFFLCFREHMANIFTKDHNVAAAVTHLSPLLAFSILLNSIQPVLSGVAVGAGRQSAVVYVNLGSYYLIGIPTGVLLGYVIKLQVEGVWIGMLIGTCIQTIILMILTKRTDWEKQSPLLAQELINGLSKLNLLITQQLLHQQILNSISKECYMFLIFPAKVSYTSLVYVKCDMDYDVDS
ncbi:UNVERIFIED_CONTAM: protein DETOXIFICATION 21 [Sesamum latifolium]|uniref:Protein DETOXIFICATION n=1 Tax=Sesamum latifolium TaxID=2727402 RepID=A0AAW2XJP3_9LAMI